MNARKGIALLVAMVILSGIAACGATPEPQVIEKVVKETVIVTQEVEKIVTQEVEVVVTQEVEKVVKEMVIVTQEAVAGCPSGGVLRHAQAPIGHLDPAFGGSISDNEVATVWMDFFVRLDATGRPDLEHSLAEAVEVSDDGTEWTFTLRNGVQFRDGKPLTAEDIVFTYGRLRDPDLGTATVGLYANITDIEAIDDHTVLFTMENPNPNFFARLG